ncbi:hypothetical protein BSR29_05760 [Boudabousia liubingyangii]|uniref:Serine aminopeptidase S33 domain-containing protein n=1 Tax=Boudabousia liubingyangii TaxID=1921764 RepID=A0A1Q5PLQ0_9ACTO|nr:alpha/beta hydrolase [Boudabousia liubingyangii]OKL47984.1 hypothetical protein BSR29_05760 [Boudabousia liubingyangii]
MPADYFFAPTDHWGDDVLGAGFYARALPLEPDEEGEVVATLVRHDPETDPEKLPGTPGEPRFNVLYLHGWNDYFFQKELARHTARAGGGFYGLDLRKYGRSLREYQTFGYVDTLEVYDEDLHAALKAIRAYDRGQGREAPLPLVLMGHSTGGLTAAMWADRHPGALAGLVLNSPWLELQTAASIRGISTPIVQQVAARNPKRVLPLGGGTNFYGMSLTGWLESDGPVPPELADWPDDPSVKGGWQTNELWKNPHGNATRAGWFHAIISAHAVVAEGLNVDCPVFVGASVQSSSGDVWQPIMRRQDTVLDVHVIALRAIGLGRNVQLVRYESKHDITLSDPEVRMEFYRDLYRWYDANLRDEQGRTLAADEPAEIKLCP